LFDPSNGAEVLYFYSSIGSVLLVALLLTGILKAKSSLTVISRALLDPLDTLL
jgi:hypothetical protein